MLPFCWSRLHTQGARYSAAKRLSKDLKRYDEGGYEISIIAHSQGGNVAIQAIQLARLTRVHLATLATPFLRMRTDSISEHAGIIAGAILCALYGMSCIFGLYETVHWRGLYEMTGNRNSDVYRILAWFIPVSAIFVGMIFGYKYWLHFPQKHLARYIGRHRRVYECSQLKSPIDVIVIYRPRDSRGGRLLIRDEAEKLLSKIHHWAAALSRWQLAARACEMERWGRTANPHKWPGIFAGCSVVLAAIGMLVWVHLIPLLMALLFALVATIWVLSWFVRETYRALPTIGITVLSTIAKVVYGVVVVGGARSFFGLSLIARSIPVVPPEHRSSISLVPLPEREGGRRFHSIYDDKQALRSIITWMSDDPHLMSRSGFPDGAPP